MKQKQIKAIKKQIVEESAINVGYYESVIPAIIENIDPDTFYHLMGRTSGEWLLEAAKSNNRAEFQNILVSEAVKTMSYSDFKSIAHYFFSYQQTSEEIIAKPLKATTDLFSQLQNESDKVFAVDGQKNINFQDISEEKSPLLGIENYQKYQVEYHRTTENKDDFVSVSTGTESLNYNKDMIIISSYREDYLTEEEKEKMKEIADFKLNNPEKSMDEFTTKFEATQNKILEDLREAQYDFKRETLEKSHSEIFDSASKILYVSDALFELEGFIEDFTLEDYKEHSYIYEKQMCALFDRYATDTPQNAAEIFILSATEAYYKSDVNYEVGTDDKAYFMEDYISNYFELSPYIKSYERKVESPKTVENDVDIKDNPKGKGI